jgi:hypothetical protein
VSSLALAAQDFWWMGANRPPIGIEPAEGAARRRALAKKLADQIPAIRDLAAKAPVARVVEQVAAAIGGANQADVEQILDSLAAPLQTPGTSSGSSDDRDSWAVSSDGHTGRLGYPCC